MLISITSQLEIGSWHRISREQNKFLSKFCLTSTLSFSNDCADQHNCSWSMSLLRAESLKLPMIIAKKIRAIEVVEDDPISACHSHVVNSIPTLPMEPTNCLLSHDLGCQRRRRQFSSEPIWWLRCCKKDSCCICESRATRLINEVSLPWQSVLSSKRHWMTEVLPTTLLMD